MRTLKNIRDFLTEEMMKWLPSNMQVRNCILLKEQKVSEDKHFSVVLHVFDETGTYMGTIEKPDYIPNSR